MNSKQVDYIPNIYGDGKAAGKVVSILRDDHLNK